MIPVQKSAEASSSLEATPAEAVSSVEQRATPAVLERSLLRARRRGNALRWGAIVLVVLLIEFVFVYLVSAGKYTGWPTYNLNYDMQAEGFRKGHLYLSVDPPPELVAKENPLDPANSELWFADLSIYKGRYYNYWGPFPAMVIAAYKAVMKVRSPVGDQYPVFVLYSIYLIAGALLIDRVARRIFPGLPLYIVLLSILVFALANPTPFMIATPGIYEAAIAGGQAFLLVGLVFAFDALIGKRRFLLVRLFAAGTAWAIAIACRVSVAPVAALFVLLTALMPLAHSGKRWLAVLRNLVWLGTPIALAVFGLLYYNRARFDQWFEFGTNWMLNTVHIRTSFDYIAANLYSYFLRKPVTGCQFPFFVTQWDMPKAFPDDFDLAEGYWVQEPVVGMLRVVPWAWLLPLGVFFGVRAILPRLGAGPRPSLNAVSGSKLWCACCFGIMGTVSALPSIGVFGATMRYLGDVTAGLVLFATWGGWSLYQLCCRMKWTRRAIGALMSVLALATIVYGLLIGYQGYNQHFQLYNPELHEKVTRALDFCPKK